MTQSTVTPETPSRDLESFRHLVHEWIIANRAGVGAPVDAADLTLDQFHRNRDFLRRLGTMGWYAPSWPETFGGGGLGFSELRIIREELANLIPHLENVHSPGDVSGAVAGSLITLGDSEQQHRFLPEILRGQTVIWELYTEPDAGSDLPSLRTTAVRQGDTYTLDGTKTFVGGHFEYDYMFVLAVTDPEGARQKNLSVFLVPAGTAGITITDLNMIAGSKKRTITLDDVKVPAANRIGREGDGWSSFTSMFAGQKYGPVGIGVIERDLPVLQNLLKYCRTTTRNGRALSSDAHSRRTLTRLWIEGSWEELMRARNEAIIQEGGRFSYEGAQTTLNRKLFDLSLGQGIHSVLGPLASISDRSIAPMDGEFEFFQRHAILHAHPGGTVEVQRLRMYRGMQMARPDLLGEGGTSNGTR